MHLLVRIGAAAVLAALLSAPESGAHREQVCGLSQLALSVRLDVSAATGHNPFVLHLTNRSGQSCVVNGYPRISFSDSRGSVLPFVVNHRGDQQVSSGSPKPVLIRPGRAAFVALQKYRCDLGYLRAATSMRVAFPKGAAGTGAVVDLRALLGGRIAYCRGSGTNVVSVSPFVPTIAGGFKRWG